MKMVACSVVLFLGLLALVNAQSSCPGPKWTLDRGTGRCYWFNKEEELPSYSADEHCRRYWDGHLVSVDDMVENQFLVDNFPAGGSQALIGANDKASEGYYVWFADNTPVPQFFPDRFYQGNFPADYRNDGRSDCVVVNVADGTWVEVRCNYDYNYICECTAR